MADAPRRKLIEVALPLEAINRESAREKSIRHGHPSTLHLWWARRPLAAARAVLFAQLVDDPSSFPDRFPTEEDQRVERERLHNIIERLVVWENVRDEKLLAEAHEEILKSTDGNPPPILDPFAGGGTIPLEAQRLGLEAHASDLNPVAVLINKALIEIPPKFRDLPPVFPGLAESRSIGDWHGTEGLAADVRAYGEWMRGEAEQRIGHLYPKVDGRTVVAWIWARTVVCPNPACRIEMPLTRSWWLRNKKDREAYVVPLVVNDVNASGGNSISFEIGRGPVGAPSGDRDGTVGRTGATCVACGTSVEFKYIRAEGRAGRMGQQLMATVVEGHRERLYFAPSADQTAAARDALPVDVPDAPLPPQAPSFRVQAYGMQRWSDLFTTRQLAALTVLGDLVDSVKARACADANARGLSRGPSLEEGGGEAAAYGDAIAVYLAMALSKLADRGSTIVTWFLGRESTRNTFARQALPMTWDFVEPNQFASGTGSWRGAVTWTAEALEELPASATSIKVEQADAAIVRSHGAVISTDPPYYDNIGYSDLSDFFYVWLRRALRPILPSLFSTLLVPKADELVANPYRHDGKEGAKSFFEDGFRRVFANARLDASNNVPITVYYAFKQSEADPDGRSYSGWETLLDGMVRSNWAITATWPIRSELGNRMLSSGTNALASSIVLALRPRPTGASTVDRRGFIVALQAELPDALRKLQQGLIAPVDLPQAAIGPGMAIFSRYAQVIEADGSPMSVRSALARINEILDQVLNEQEGDFDPVTRFAIAWYRQHGYTTGKYGDAEQLASGRNTTVDFMQRNEILVSRAGKVTLVRAEETPVDYDVLADPYTSAWEALHHMIRIVGSDGLPAAGQFLATAENRSDGAIEGDLVKELAFLLFSVAEKNGWTKDAQAFNTLASSWADILDASRTTTPRVRQGELELEVDE